MVTSIGKGLRPIFYSTNGIHFTAYVPQEKSQKLLVESLESSFQKLELEIREILCEEERRKFLNPLNSLLENSHLLSRLQGNLGIFRNQSGLRILRLPIEIESSLHLATTFHVKPLLRWIQSDPEFLVLVFQEKSAYLYLASQRSMKLIGAVAEEDVLLHLKSGNTDQMDILSLFGLLPMSYSNNLLFYVGDLEQIYSLSRALKEKLRPDNTLVTRSGTLHLNDLHSTLFERVRELINRNAQALLDGFNLSQGSELIKRNLFQIAKAAVNGRVEKLLISQETKIFGKIDLQSGGLSLHAYDQDHEDDDLLDDLAQIVLQKGGEVMVSPQKAIPQGRPILALLRKEPVDSRSLPSSQSLFSMRRTG